MESNFEKAIRETAEANFQRNEVVKNGCSGGCCTAFTFGWTLEDLRKNQEAIANNKMTYINSEGYERRVLNDDSIESIIDMLIFIELTEQDPQLKNTFTEQVTEDFKKRGTWPGSIKDLPLYEKQELDRKGFVIREDKVLCRVYTCKHFDKEKKICNNYENRPHMCKNFGASCRYEGCNYNC
jgi:Fe-S-cluster containining protein